MTDSVRSAQSPLMNAASLPLTRTAAAAPQEPTAPAPPVPAFAAIYREHFAWVWRALRRLGVREADLPDLTHDVFVVVHRKLGDFDPRRPLKPWLFGISFRIALDKKRKHSSFREALTDDVQAPSPLPTSEDLMQARQAHDAVMRALDVLDEPKRAVFVMHELEGLSMPEIAEIVDAPLNTLYSRLRLAREAFTTAVRAQATTRTGGAR